MSNIPTPVNMVIHVECRSILMINRRHSRQIEQEKVETLHLVATDKQN